MPFSKLKLLFNLTTLFSIPYCILNMNEYELQKEMPRDVITECWMSRKVTIMYYYEKLESGDATKPSMKCKNVDQPSST